MRYIKDAKKLAKIQEWAKGGDEEAKNFLFNFMNMDDDKANEYLAYISTDDDDTPINTVPTNEQAQQTSGDGANEWIQIIKELIADENEAIDGYDKAIKYIANVNIDEATKSLYMTKLNHIKDEEIEHIEELKELLGNGIY